MSWAVVTASEAWADLDQLADAERDAVTDALLTWTGIGPPRRNRRALFGLDEVYEDEVVPTIWVNYFADDQLGVIAVLRIRRRRSNQPRPTERPD